MTTESREQDHGSARASRKSRGSPAIIEAGGSGAWRAIESAPKDGTHILVTSAWNGGLGYCGPLNEHGFRDPADWCDVVHWFDDPDEPGFYSTSWGGEQEHPFGGLTHWMPLPAAPAKPDPLARCARCGARHIEHDREPDGYACPDREGVFLAGEV